MRTHYDNLKVAPDAPDLVIKASYKALIQKYHSDKFDDEKKRKEALRITKIIVDAFDVLSDPIKRAEHDEWIKNNKNDASHSDKLVDSDKLLNEADGEHKSRMDIFMELFGLTMITMSCGICGLKLPVETPHCLYCGATFERDEVASWLEKLLLAGRYLISFIFRFVIGVVGLYVFLYVFRLDDMVENSKTALFMFRSVLPFIVLFVAIYVVNLGLIHGRSIYAKKNQEKAECKVKFPIQDVGENATGFLLLATIGLIFVSIFYQESVILIMEIIYLFIK